MHAVQSDISKSMVALGKLVLKLFHPLRSPNAAEQRVQWKNTCEFVQKTTGQCFGSFLKRVKRTKTENLTSVKRWATAAIVYTLLHMAHCTRVEEHRDAVIHVSVVVSRNVDDKRRQSVLTLWPLCMSDVRAILAGVSPACEQGCSLTGAERWYATGLEYMTCFELDAAAVKMDVVAKRSRG